MIVSERIFQLLKEQDISQKEFSEKTGIAQSTISDWKRKKTNPAADKIMAICDVLKVTPYDLLSGTENPDFKPLDYVIVGKDSKEYEMLMEFRKLDNSRQQRVLGYLEGLLEI